MRLVWALGVVVLVIAACSSDATEPTAATTTAPTTSTTSSVAPSTPAPPTTTTTSTTTTTIPAAFSGDRSFALQPGPEDWASTFVDPGAVVFHDGQWHMFYNGIERWPAHVKVGYATSEDGRRWVKQADEPVFVTDAIEYAGVSAFMSDVEVLDDGTWAMWFYTVQSGNSFATGVVGRATAPGPTGPWTPDPGPAR